MEYIDSAIRRQILLERLKASQSEKFDKAFYFQLKKLIRSRLIDVDIEDLSRSQLARLINGMTKEQAQILDNATAALGDDMETLAGMTVSSENHDLTKAIGKTTSRASVKVPAALIEGKAYRNALARPLSTNGSLLKPFIKNSSAFQIDALNNIIRKGHQEGKGSAEIIKDLFGTRSKRFKDGAIEVSRRNTTTMVRTALQHVSSSARQDMWEENDDIVTSYRWLSTLDSVTSKVCRALDNKEFTFGKGPIPPIHPNCRSTTIPLFEIGEEVGGERLANEAQEGKRKKNVDVDADKTYYEWLKGQDQEYQEEAIGKNLTKLLNDGGLSNERFRELQLDKNFKPLTLDEMREKEPEAFAKAKIKTK